MILKVNKILEALNNDEKILSRISWKKIRATHHLIIIILCGCIFLKGFNFYIEILKSLFKKDSIFLYFGLIVLLVLITFYNFKKYWRFSSLAFAVLRAIHFLFIFIGLWSVMTVYFSSY